MKRMLLAASLLLVSLIATVFLWPTDERRIRKLFSEGMKAVEAENLDDAMARVSFHYHDAYGLSYLTLKETLKREFGRLSDIRIEAGPVTVTIAKSKATAEFDIRIIATAGNETSYFIGDAKDPLRLLFTVEKEHARWLIVKAEGFRGERTERGVP